MPCARARTASCISSTAARTSSAAPAGTSPAWKARPCLPSTRRGGRRRGSRRPPHERRRRRRRERRRPGSRGRACRAPGGAAGGGDRRARRGTRRRGARLRRLASQGKFFPGNGNVDSGLVSRAAGLFQGAGARGVHRRAAHHLYQQGAEGEAGRVPARPAAALRPARAQAPAGVRKGYDGVVLAAPVTVPYVRYSIRSAHSWLARAFALLLEKSSLKKEDVDGLTVSSFT